MNLATDPLITDKIRLMRERARWAHPLVQRMGIDQTRVSIANSPTRHEAFSFLVIGDSGSGQTRTDNPQRRVALRLLEEQSKVAFLIHTGDVVYLVGSSEQYQDNFIRPYREWLVGGEKPQSVSYQQMVFNKPFLPVPGNHDYYDLSPWLGLLSGVSTPLRSLMRRIVDLDVGWHGSFKGDAYARAFFDVLKDVPEKSLGEHLERNYCAEFKNRRCLSYRPGEFTRLPNRYYTYRYAGVDFFALDSNTFNQPRRSSGGSCGGRSYKALSIKRSALEHQRDQLVAKLFHQDRAEIIGKIEQIEEQILDVSKQLDDGARSQLDRDRDAVGDPDQLHWLKAQLLRSWRDPQSRGRILILHHPPYVTEATKWDQAQTLAVRDRLREVLDQVAAELGDQIGGASPVNLVLSGHAHCFELIHSFETGHADSFIPWIVCGGSGYSLRRQRAEGTDLQEGGDTTRRPLARSSLFLGRQGHGRHLSRPYSALKVDVSEGQPMVLLGTVLVTEKKQDCWSDKNVDIRIHSPLNNI